MFGIGIFGRRHLDAVRDEADRMIAALGDVAILVARRKIQDAEDRETRRYWVAVKAAIARDLDARLAGTSRKPSQISERLST